jgi:sec-independent protein translocase protein TatA
MNPFIILGIVGPTEIILIVVIVLLLFGGKKIPELMKGIGQGAREFKKGLSGESDEEKKKEETKKE